MSSNENTTVCQDLATITDFLRFGLSQAKAHDLYYGHGTDNAWDDIWALILGSLHLPLDPAPLLLQARLTLSEKQFLVNQIKRRVEARIPVPYLTHTAYFCELPFYVDERVLIPRSPIAELIQQQFAPWIESDQVRHILDICTGSGCIAIACAYAFPEARIDAVDISEDALAVAEINRQQHQMQDQVTLIASDCFSAVPQQRYDIIVSNPPYVGRYEMRTLPAEYGYEPQLALEAADNGLAIVATILQQAAAYLSEQGILVLEVGNSDEALQAAFPQIPFTWLDFEHGGHGVLLLTREQLLKVDY